VQGGKWRRLHGRSERSLKDRGEQSGVAISEGIQVFLKPSTERKTPRITSELRREKSKGGCLSISGKQGPGRKKRRVKKCTGISKEMNLGNLGYSLPKKKQRG